MGSGVETRGDALFGSLALLSGVSFLVHLGVVGALPSPDSYKELASYRPHQAVYVLLLLSIVAFSAFAVAFLGGLGRLLAPRSPLLAAAGSLVLASGILVTGIGVVLSIGALAALAELPADPTYATSATFEAAFWANLQTYTNDFGDVLMGTGLLLLSRVVWGSRILPNWLAIVGFVGGAAAFLAIVADPLAAVSFLSFTVWSLDVGVVVLRRSRNSSAMSHTGSLTEPTAPD